MASLKSQRAAWWWISVLWLQVPCCSCVASVWPFSTESCSMSSHAPITNWLERVQIHHQLALQYPQPSISQSVSPHVSLAVFLISSSSPRHSIFPSVSWHHINLCSLHPPSGFPPPHSSFQRIDFPALPSVTGVCLIVTTEVFCNYRCWKSGIGASVKRRITDVFSSFQLIASKGPEFTVRLKAYLFYNTGLYNKNASSPFMLYKKTSLWWSVEDANPEKSHRLRREAEL